ncbi:hypothetical protein SALBM311S_13029 [Streptomyces alboniger]
MSRKPVHLAVYDTLADWETGHATAYLARAGYEIRTVGPSRESVTSIGGLRIQPSCALDDVRRRTAPCSKSRSVRARESASGSA